MLKKIKPYAMPLAMVVGALFYEYVSYLAFCTPYLIATMLFITYCNISFKDIRLTKLHIWMLLIQVIGSILIFWLLSFFNLSLAQGVMICILAPTATSAVVITSMLGGNTASLTAYSLVSNIVVAFFAPLIFAFIGNNGKLSFIESLYSISQNVFTILLLPFLIAIIITYFFPKIQYKIKQIQGISFFLWLIALIVITGKTILFIVHQASSSYFIECVLALLSLVVCVSQFLIGRSIGRSYNDTIAGGQGLGQKNTILAIWMAQTYLNPISSIGPGAYVLWQNLVNSYQVWKKRSTL